MCNSKKNWDLFFCVCGSKSETDILLVPITVDGRMIIVGSNQQKNLHFLLFILLLLLLLLHTIIKLKQSALQMSCKEAEQVVKFPLASGYSWQSDNMTKEQTASRQCDLERSSLYSIRCSFWWVLVCSGQKDFPSDQNHRWWFCWSLLVATFAGFGCFGEKTIRQITITAGWCTGGWPSCRVTVKTTFPLIVCKLYSHTSQSFDRMSSLNQQHPIPDQPPIFH